MHGEILTEVYQFDISSFRHQNVLALDVAVHHMISMEVTGRL